MAITKLLLLYALGRAEAREDSGWVSANRFTARLRDNLDDDAMWARWDMLAQSGPSTAFQQSFFLRPLIRRLAPEHKARPVIVEVSDDNGRLVLAAAFVITRLFGIRVLQFADFGFADLCAPVWRKGVEYSFETAYELRRTILAAIPGVDVVHWKKMPPEINGAANPLAIGERIGPAGIETMLVDATSWSTLPKSWAKDLARKRRRLGEHGGAVRRLTDVDEALAGLERLYAMRAARSSALGIGNSLESLDAQAFYRDVLREGIARGKVKIFEVSLEGRPVAYVLGLLHAGRFNGTLMGIENDPLALNLGPGIVAIAAAGDDHFAHEDGMFDMGTGAQDYKSRFGARPMMLMEHFAGLTVRGVALRRIVLLRRWLRSKADALPLVSRWFGQKREF